jgi:phage tail-like protein
MRGLVDGLRSPHPLGSTLPPIYLEDSLTQRITAGLDEVLAPVLNVLDNLDAYLDPALAPSDFYEWLAGWVGVVLDESWSPDRQRALIRQAAKLYALRGTARGLAAHVALFVEGEVEIEETGAATWSAVPGAAVPGNAVPHLKVRVRAADPGKVDVRRLEAVISSSKPADVPHDIEVIAR